MTKKAAPFKLLGLPFIPNIISLFEVARRLTTEGLVHEGHIGDMHIYSLFNNKHSETIETTKHEHDNAC
jgi:hypothetical protein